MSAVEATCRSTTWPLLPPMTTPSRPTGVTGEELAPDAGGETGEENLRLLAESGMELIIANGTAVAQNVWLGVRAPSSRHTVRHHRRLPAGRHLHRGGDAKRPLHAVLRGAAGRVPDGRGRRAWSARRGGIGSVGGVEVPLILKLQAGFEAGALAANPDITILPAVYLTQVPDFTGFNDPVKGKEAALALYGQGADVIFHAAGGSGLGLFEAAVEQSTDDSFLWAISVDSDQYEAVGDPDLQEHILTSMLKRVDVAVDKAIVDFLNDEFTPGRSVSGWPRWHRLPDLRWLRGRHRGRPRRLCRADHLRGDHSSHRARGLTEGSPANFAGPRFLGPAFYLDRGDGSGTRNTARGRHEAVSRGSCQQGRRADGGLG